MARWVTVNHSATRLLVSTSEAGLHLQAGSVSNTCNELAQRVESAVSDDLANPQRHCSIDGLWPGLELTMRDEVPETDEIMHLIGEGCSDPTVFAEQFESLVARG